MIDQDIGVVGEKVLSAWINSSGGSASRPDRDMFGWDLYVELPISPTAGPIDAGSSKIAMYFQVKSTRKAKTTEQISLRNMKLAADDPAPFFFLFLEFNSDGTETVRAYATHFDDELMSRTLGRIRAAEFEGKAGWERETISVTPAAKDELEALFGPSLVKRVRRIVGDPRQYARWKSGLRDTIGFGDYRFTIEARVEAGTQEAPLEHLISAALGKTARLPAHDVHVVDVRFAMPISVTRDETGYLELVGQGSPDWIMELADGESGTRVIWPAKMYSTFGLSQLAEHVARQIVWRNDFIECLLSEHGDATQLQVKTCDPLNISATLGQLRDLATTYKVLADARVLKVQFKHLRPPMPTTSGSAQVAEMADARTLRRIAQTLEAFVELAPHNECPADFTFPVRDVLAWERELDYLANLAQGKPLFLRLTPVDFPGANAGERVAVAPAFCLKIGEAFLIASIPALGELSHCSESGDENLLLETTSKLPATVRILPCEDLKPDWRTTIQTQALQQFPGAITKVVFEEE